VIPVIVKLVASFAVAVNIPDPVIVEPTKLKAKVSAFAVVEQAAATTSAHKASRVRFINLLNS
jgi:hypothetical protein